jgi:two-component system KDP operon response regulator KdpE
MMPRAERILVVDDDPTFRKMLDFNLRARDYLVDLAASGGAALELIERQPDRIVLDLGLPDIDGIDLIGQLRTSAITPILVVSAPDTGSAEPAALGAGANDYLAKPFGIQQLMSRVHTILSSQPPPNGHSMRFSA